jgi:Bacterial Ig-like domain (group 2)/Divergent InlB B-repeat domain
MASPAKLRLVSNRIRFAVIWPLLLLCPAANAITFSNQTVTTQAPPPTGCTVPTAKSSFSTTDGTVYLYFEATVSSSDALTNDWLAPDGSSVSPASWDSDSGDFCFTGGSVFIGNLPPSQLGAWRARVFDNGNLLFSIPFTVSAPAVSGASYYFPQLAFGGGFQTTLTYVNYSPQPVTCQTMFYSDAGGALQVPFPGGPVSQRTDNFAAGADIHVETNAAAGSQNQGGWAVAQCSAPVKASLLYRVYSGGVPQGEASVNATTTPTTEFVTFAQTYTGLAYANPSATAATVTINALSSGGNLLGTTSFGLAPNAHGAANIGPLLGLNSFTGSIQITSTVPIVSLSLNAEDFPVFSSLPPGDLPAGTALATGNGSGGSTNGTFTSYFPQLAFGGGFQTTLTYVNYSPQSVTCKTMFYSDAGGALQVPFPGGPVSQRTDNLAAGADIHVETNAAAGSQNQGGWAVAQCSAPVKASLLYRVYSGGVPQGEASVNATTTPTTEFATFAQTYTGVAYANPSASAATVTITALDSAGYSLGATFFPLAPNAHGAANVGPLLGLTSFAGSVQVTSTVPIVSLSLNAEDFPVFSSLPPGDVPAGTLLGSSPGTVTLQSIQVTPNNPAIPAGITLQLTAVGSYVDGSQRNITSAVNWSSSNSAIATINASGLVTGVSAGIATITAAFGPVTGTISLTVGSPSQRPALTITLSGSGSGTVTAAPAGVSCGSGCLSFPTGTQVALTATPNTGSTFNGWSGACSGTGACTVTMNSNQAVTAAFNLVITSTLAITAVSSSSPTALTPLYISTAGLDTTQPFSVKLANASGYHATLTPIRTQADGTVVIAVPIYINPTTGNTNSLNAALTISQGPLTSPPMNLSIQDAPMNSDYGTSLGQISSAFYVYQQLSLGRMQNGFQAIQAAPRNSVDTRAIQAHISTQLANAILAKSDVQQIIANSSAQLGTGTLPDGTTISFNSNSVEMMDRIFGMYLTAIQPQIVAAARIEAQRRLRSGIAVGANATAVFNSGRRRLGTDRVVQAGRPHALNLASLLPKLGVVGAGETIAGAIRTDWNADSTVVDRLIASEAGAYAGLLIYGTVVGGIGAISGPAIVAAAGTAGLVIGLAAIGNDIYKLATDPNNILTGSNSGGNTSTLSAAINALKSNQGTLALDSTAGLLGALAVENGVPPSFGQTVANFLEPNGSGQLAIQGGALLNSTIQLFAQFAPNSATDQTTAQAAASQFSSPFPSPSQGFGTVQGNVDISNSQGPGLAGLTGIQVIDPGSGVQFSNVADTSGNYQVLVSLGDTTVNYNRMTLNAFDPITSFENGSLFVLSTQPIDLAGLTSTSTFNAPELFGMCVDTDAGDPDSDDPDCD